MKLFAPLFEKVMHWSRHPKASWYLAGLSFAESSFFPVPPDVMLAPMALGQPKKAWRYALLTTLMSVAGGIAGYLIGMLFFSAIEPWLQTTSYWEKFLTARNWFDEWGVWVVLLAGFSPVPYKVFTISAGVVNMAFVPFVLASLLGRGARFYIVAGLMRWGGEGMEARLKQYVDILGWLVIAAVAGYLLLRQW